MRSVIVLAVAFITARPGIAHAAEPTAEDLIVRGLELRRAAKPSEALEMFRRAYALSPSARTLGQMGLVEASLEQWLDAETHVMAALAKPEDAWVRKNRTFLDEALQVSRGHIGELVVTGPSGTTVAVDGKRAGMLPAVAPVRLVEGRAVVRASSAGFKDFSKTVTITGGARSSLAIVLDPIDKRAAVAIAAPVPLPAPVPPPAATALDEPGARSWEGPVGVGLVAAGAGLMAWGITWIAVDHRDSCPVGGPGCDSVYDTKRAGWILTTGGAAAAGAGAVLFYLGHRDDRSNVALDVTPRFVSLRGRF